MLTTVRSTRRKLPPGWPQKRYEEFNRAAKVGALVAHLLREQYVHTAEEASDELITTVARDFGIGATPPSATTCEAVRDTITRLVPTPLPDTSDADAMEQIHQLLTGQPWNAETLLKLTRIVGSTGRPVADTDF